MWHPMSSPFTSVLLGEQSASKTDAWGSTPHARAAAPAANCRCGSIKKGVRLVSGSMLVRIQSSALCPRPDGVADCIGPSEGPGPGSSPGRDTDKPCGCGGRMTVFEAVGRGSIPRWGTDTTVLGVCRNAREPAKLVDQVRFLARTLIDTDAGARRPGGCLQSSLKWVRLPPASL
jgi:hypothetical protein